MPVSFKRRLTLAASVSLLFFLGGELPSSAQQAASFTYDQRGRLTVFVAPDGMITKYVYDAAGNISSIERGTAADLIRIDSVTPNTGVVPGNTLTIIGQNFDPVASNNTVLFTGVSGSVPALVTGASATQLTVHVPQGAVTGAIRVQRLGQTVTGPVVTIQNLTVANISPTTPVVSGSTITLTGQGFSLNANGNAVSFLGAGGTSIPVTVTTTNATQLSVQVPAGAVSGLISVASGAQTVQGPNIQIQTLQVTGVTPIGPYLPGATITLSGAGFSLLPGGNIVTFAGANGTTIPVTATTSDQTQLSVVIPLGVVSGAVSVSVAPQTATGPVIQIQTLQITSVSPTTLVGPGNTITINGQGFSDILSNNVVRFTGANGTIISATPATASFSQLTVEIPVGAISGPILVSVPPQTAQGPNLTLAGVISVLPSTSVVSGQILSITGENFNTVAPNLVFFGDNASVSVQTTNPSQLSVQVPLNAVSAPLKINVGSTTITGPNITIVSPAITSIAPDLPVTTGAILTITGQGFSLLPNANTVTFSAPNNIFPPVAIATAIDSNHLSFQVPQNVITGPITIRVGSQSLQGPTLQVAGLAIEAISPNIPVPRNSEVTIMGQGFPSVLYLDNSTIPNVSASFVGSYSSAVQANIIQTSPTQMVVQVPSDAVNGPVTVTTSTQTAVSQSISIKPSQQITAVTPSTNLVPKQIVTIEGQNFNSTSLLNNTVYFPLNNGQTFATVLSVTATQLTVEVPIDFSAGAIQVSVDGLTATGPNISPVPLVITSVSPNVGVAPGQTVLITGQGFNPYLANGDLAPQAQVPQRILVASTDLRIAAVGPPATSLTQVFFSDCQGGLVQGTVQGATDTRLSVQVPSGTCNGPITVQALGQTAIGPSITSQSSSNSVQIVEVPMPPKMVSFSELVERTGK